MKNKISKILGVALSLAMLTSMLVVGSPASAGTLSWSAELGPSTTTYVLASGSDVTDLAASADGNTVFAVSSVTTNNLTLKSTNGGATWTKLTLTAVETPRLVATAPGDANIVVIVGDNTSTSNLVILSNDGGTTFSLLTGHTMTAINDVAISPLTASVRYITLAGASASGADIQYLNLGALVSTWTSLVTGTGWASFAGFSANLTVNAIAFSPNFASDKVMVAANADPTSTNATLQIASFSSTKWNTAAGFTGYPVPFLAGAPTAASISLAPTYLGADETLRLAFVGVVTSANGILVRLENTTVKSLKATTGISSVDFNGTDLVAGASASTAVYYGANPTSSLGISETATYQRPGGATAVKVAWAGANVLAGTTGAASALALSKDKGVSFNDVSMIDTVLTNITDIAVAKDATTLYAASNDLTNTSIWRKTTAWERVFNLSGAATYIIRLAPESAATVYLADTASTTLYFSDDSGEKKWLLRSLISTPVDLAVESAQVSYALSTAGKVSKSSNGGFTWDPEISTGLGQNGATIVSVKKDQLLVGGTGGGVAWSTDGNAAATTWVAKTTVISSGGAMQATADKLDTGGFIYAAGATASGNVVRWKVGTSVVWDDIISGTTTGAAGGVALSEGVLYVLTNNSATDNMSYLSRTLIPTTATSSTIWTSKSVGSSTALISLGKAPQALKASTGKLWTVNDAASDSIYSFTDTTYKTAPTAATPADQATPQTNPVSGESSDLAFSWAKLSDSTAYKLEISLDTAFTQIVLTHTATPSPSTLDPIVVVVGRSQTGTQLYNFTPGITYYWRVTATLPLDSPASATRSFMFSSLDKPFGLAGPTVGATEVGINPILTWSAYTGAKWYEVTLSEDPTFAIPEWSHNVNGLVYGVTETLKYGTTYYWRVRGVTADPYVLKGAVITPAGPWVVGAFTTKAEPVKQEPVVVTVPAPAPPVQIITLPAPPPVEKAAPIPSWMLMTIIVIGAILVIALIVLIVRTRRVA
ncbi:MAG TPA: hypothetical protein VJK47_02775 [Dehalococcoidales bacterium]|nr:hypothetical protein [Dehalococcoidales bacterium]